MNKTRWEDEKNVHKRIKNAKENLPYQFISINSSKAKSVKNIKLSENIGITGKLKCTLQVLNGLILSNEHSNENIYSPLIVSKKGNNQLEKHFFISPYTLKGCLRQFIASFQNVPLKQTNNESFFYRPNQFFGRNDKVGIAAGFVKEIHDDGSFEANLIEPPFCFTKKNKKDKRGNTIVEMYREWNYKTIKKNQKIEVLYQNRKEDEMYFTEYRDGIDGKASFNDLFGGNKSHDAFGYLVNNKKNITVEAHSSIHLQYKKMPDLIIKYHLNNHPLFTEKNIKEKGIDRKDIENNIKDNWRIKKGDLILYEYDTKTNTILSFGKHFRYLWTYKNSVWDFEEFCILDIENFKKSTFFVTDEMFGFSYSKEQKKYLKSQYNFDLDEKDKNKKPIYKSSKSGKVHFNYAKYVNGSGVIDHNFKVPGTDTPHASSYEFYLKQDEDKEYSDNLNNYGDRFENDFSSNLSGRKIYRRSFNYIKNMELQRSNGHIGDIKTTLFKSQNDKIATFKFTINFENLSDYEFQLLLFSLTLGNNKKITSTNDSLNTYCHQIGYAKNFGLGAVKINIDKILIGEFKDNSICLSEKTLSDIEESESQSEFFNSLKNAEFEFMKITKDEFQYPLDFSYKGRGEHRKEKGRDIYTIYSWHSQVRKQDHENRKKNYSGSNHKNSLSNSKFNSKKELNNEIEKLKNRFE